MHLRRIFRTRRKTTYCNADGLCNLPFAVIGNGYRDGEHRATLSGGFEGPAARIEQGTGSVRRFVHRTAQRPCQCPRSYAVLGGDLGPRGLFGRQPVMRIE